MSKTKSPQNSRDWIEQASTNGEYLENLRQNVEKTGFTIDGKIIIGD